MKDTRVLVAGGTGLVGTNLTLALVTRGWEVLSTSYKSPPKKWLKEYYSCCDLTNFDNCLSLTQGMDIVIIAAAQIAGVAQMKSNPTETLLPNFNITLGLMEAASRNGVKHLVFLSSSTVYQSVDYPITEDELKLDMEPFQLYQGVGWFNRYCEQAAKLYNDKTEMNIIVLRLSNVYGPFDKFEDGKSHVLPALIKRALKKEDPFVVWGRDDIVRDFLYVGDLVEDLISLMELGYSGSALNVGSGYTTTIGQAVECILNACNHSVDPVYDAKKPTAIRYRALDITRLNRVLVNHNRTSLEEGLQETINWYRSTQVSN